MGPAAELSACLGVLICVSVVVAGLAVHHRCELCVALQLSVHHLAVHNPVVTSLHTAHLQVQQEQQQQATPGAQGVCMCVGKYVPRACKQEAMSTARGVSLGKVYLYVCVYRSVHDLNRVVGKCGWIVERL